MTYSVHVTNNSGASQFIAIVLADASGGSDFSLVWFVKGSNNGSHVVFSWDPTLFSLGWGITPKPLDVGVLFSSLSPAISVFPDIAGGVNVLPVLHNKYGFYTGTPYVKKSLFNKLEVITDRSFTVSDARDMSVVLYIDKRPALAVQGAPNTIYNYDISQLRYYLTVTDYAESVAIPQFTRQDGGGREYTSVRSISIPFEISFCPEKMDLKYILNENLNFIRD